MARVIGTQVAKLPATVVAAPRTDETEKWNASKDSFEAIQGRGILVASLNPSRLNGQLNPVLGGAQDADGLLFCPAGLQTLEHAFELPDMAKSYSGTGVQSFSLQIRFILAYYETVNNSNTAPTITGDVHGYVKAAIENSNGSQELYSHTTTVADSLGYTSGNVEVLPPGSYVEKSLSIQGALGAVKATAEETADSKLILTIGAFRENLTLGSGIAKAYGTNMEVPSPPPYLGILSASLTIYNVQ